MSDTEKKELVKQIENKMREIRSKRSPNHQWKLSDFEIGCRVGSGKFGRVYLAREKETEYMVGLKIMIKSKLVNNHMVHQVQQEIENQTKLSHPNILQLLTYFWDEEKIYLILEFATEGGLLDALKKTKHHRFDENTTAYYIRQVASALSYCHTKGVIHRDVKPENVLLFGNHVVKLADFGLSVHVSSKKTLNTVCGTLDYLSPEMVNRKNYKKFVDVWSLGVLCYEFLSGYPPFESNSEDDTFKKISAVSYNFKHFISDGSKTLIKSLLVKKPSKRLALKNVIKHPWIKKNCDIFTKKILQSQ